VSPGAVRWTPAPHLLLTCLRYTTCVHKIEIAPWVLLALAMLAWIATVIGGTAWR